MKKNFYRSIVSLVLVISGCCFSTTTLAQVTVGAGESITYGALLELKNKQAGTVVNVDDDENITSTNGGLLLPRVKLNPNNLNSLAEVLENSSSLTAQDKLKLAGLTVYNLVEVTNKILSGVYVWNGTTWVYLVENRISSPTTINKQPKAFSFYETGLETPDPLVFEVIPPRKADGTLGTVSYQWYIMNSKNVNATVGTAITAVDAQTASYSPTVVFKTTNSSKSTRYAQNNDLYRLYCVATGSDGTVVQSNTVEVAVGCGAKNNLGQWISFMCFNLGATNGITMQQQKDYNIGVFVNDGNGVHTYITGEEKVWGDLYQWGRIGDGHEKRLSDVAPIATDIKDYIKNGYFCTRNAAGDTYGNLYPYQQITPDQVTASPNPYYGKYIRTFSSFNYNWYPQAASVNGSIDNLWQNGRYIPNDPCAKYKADGTFVPYWTTSEVPAGANQVNPNPACAESGTSWKTPTMNDFGAIFKDGAISGLPSSSISNNWDWYDGTTTNYNKGFEIKTDAITTTLYLPANGYKSYSNATLVNPGREGRYWTTDIIGNQSYNMYFYRTLITPADAQYRAMGFGIRCIKQN